MNRRDFLALSSATVLSEVANAGTALPQSGTEGSAATHARKSQPNLILFMPDEMRADSLACYGNPITKTPNFDRLAREGARFDQCHVQFPVCGASRCAMLTGWPTSVRGHRSLYYFLRPEEPNLFRYLRRAGYDVFWFGKNDALASQTFSDSVTYWSDAGGPAGRAKRPEKVTPGSVSMLYTAGGNDRRESADYHHLQSAIEVLKRKETDRPFCIFLPLSNPHPPYTVSADFYNMYAPASLPPLVPPGLRKKPSFHEGMRSLYNLDHLSDETFRKARAVYYGQVSYSDWLLGELMEALEATGRDKDTALFVTSDHGDYAGDYGLIEKWPSGLEDCLTRVPMLARVPGGKGGVTDPHMREMYDIMQTCLDLAGIPREETHTHFSRSLLPQIDGAAGDPQRAAFSEGGYNIYEPQCFEPIRPGVNDYTLKTKLQHEQPQTVSRAAMVRTATHKLIMRPQGQSELYAYTNDPHEMQNLYGDSSVATIQNELQGKLLTHYINTTGIAPMDKDPRNAPPCYPVAWELYNHKEADKILDL